jgi:HK97 family phage major capsid protein
MASLTEVREEMKDLRDQLHIILQQAGPTIDMSKVSAIQGTSEEKLAEVQRINNELSTLGQQHDRLALAENVLKTNAAEMGRIGTPSNGVPFPGGEPPKPQITSKAHLSQMLAEHKGSQRFRSEMRGSVSIDIPVAEFKTLIALTTVNVPAQRVGNVNMALEERTVSDLMLQGQTNNNQISYFEETTFTNAADTREEGIAKPESALDWTEQTENVRKIAHWIPATTEALADIPFLESQIRGRLAFGVRRKEEEQVLLGNGTSPNISGILDRTNIQTQAKGSLPTPDAIYLAMQKVRGSAGAGFAEPTAYVTHPNDWSDVKLLRTTEGIYLWGNPSDEGPDRIWGLEVRQTTAMTENTGLVGDFRMAEVFRRDGITVTLSTEHASYFIENKVAILAESRLALAVYRPSAFCTVTGI